MKQIIKIKLDGVENPYWSEANWYANHRHDRGVVLVTKENKCSWLLRQDLNLGPPNPAF